LKQSYTSNRFCLFLTPFSLLYGVAVSLRNYLFDRGILKQYHPPVPLVVVGNLTVGGTGKTTMVITLARLLDRNDRPVAILSRGYGRRSKGFRMVTTDTDPGTAGDEPVEIKQALPEIMVAVDRNRAHGIRRLLQEPDPPKLILMDDGFQHRWVTPAYSIILSDAGHPLEKQRLLPAGRLREPLRALKRANALVITKISGLSDYPDIAVRRKQLNLTDQTLLLYSRIEYQDPRPLHPVYPDILLKDLKKQNAKTLLITGIAQPGYLAQHLREQGVEFDHLCYRDHYNYTLKEIRHLKKSVQQTGYQVILTTQKDAVKIKSIPGSADLPVYFLPIKFIFDSKQLDQLIRKIITHV